MPIDMFGLVIGKGQAENRGLQPPDSTRIGLISSMMGNPVMSLVISRKLTDNQLQELAPPPAPPTGGQEEPGHGEPRTDFERALQERVNALSTKVDQIQTTLAEIQQRLPPVPAGDGEPKGRNRGGG